MAPTALAIPRIAAVITNMPIRHTAALAVALTLLLACCAMNPADRTATPRLSHDVYFTLNDNSDQARRTLVDACYTRLAQLPGITWFAAGTRAPDLQRDVNDQGYDVSLHVFFVDRAAHDAYQTAPAHVLFIAENKANWKAVRVFDSDLAGR